MPTATNLPTPRRRASSMSWMPMMAVVVEVPAGVRAVGADPADDGGQVEDHVRPSSSKARPIASAWRRSKSALRRTKIFTGANGSSAADFTAQKSGASRHHDAAAAKAHAIFPVNDVRETRSRGWRRLQFHIPGRHDPFAAKVLPVNTLAVTLEGGQLFRGGGELPQLGGNGILGVGVEDPTDFVVVDPAGDGGIAAAGEDHRSADSQRPEEFGGHHDAGPFRVQTHQMDVGRG